tara:strand:+ start:569 stop:1033 length:465 start_codon:yes stop_codon:yes gene_type:complete
MKSPWWMKGVPFSCQPECGKCCDEPGGIVFLSINDAQRIANHFDMEVSDWLERDCTQTLDGRYILNSRETDGICIYLDGLKQCEIYQVRPQQCAAFPWWSENLSSQRAWNEVKKSCPGLTSDDAIVIDGNTIRIQIFSDRQSTKGFRSWPGNKR